MDCKLEQVEIKPSIVKMALCIHFNHNLMGHHIACIMDLQSLINDVIRQHQISGNQQNQFFYLTKLLYYRM